MFEINHVSKQFGEEFALKNISATIQKGLNFIVGPSGSGKTTLLKILSGMETDYQGEVLFCGQNIAALSPKEKSDYYNHLFGFVWQDFNLLDDLTVWENILLPQYLKEQPSEAFLMNILKDLKISELAHQQVGKLSGGQKQRVAIARELAKKPKVIIADEPTSALDEKSSKVIMQILRDIAKTKTVIVVTHDTSLIDSKSPVYQLDKGELIESPLNTPKRSFSPVTGLKSYFSFSKALHLATTNSKSKMGRTAITAISFVVTATLLLVSVSGGITQSSQQAFEKLYDTYGETFLDITISESFISGISANGEERDEPNIDIKQDIDGLFEKYRQDPKVSHVIFGQPFGNIQVTVDGKKYTVENSNNVPVMNKVLHGTLPMGDGAEVAVPESFVKALGITNQEAIGKEIAFQGTVFNWESGAPIETPMQTSATIVGVIDTTMVTEFQGNHYEYIIEDSFFFSPSTLNTMRKNAGMKPEPGIFYIRAKTPEDLIALKDELNAMGIVPLGRFELVEDMVRLSAQTQKQSSGAVVLIALLALVATVAISAMTLLSRKREYAIYKVSGYSQGHLGLLQLAETGILAVLSVVLFILTSPLINFATVSLWNLSILQGTLLLFGVLFILAVSVIYFGIGCAVCASVNPATALKTGDR